MTNILFLLLGICTVANAIADLRKLTKEDDLFVLKVALHLFCLVCGAFLIAKYAYDILK